MDKSKRKGRLASYSCLPKEMNPADTGLHVMRMDKSEHQADDYAGGGGAGSGGPSVRKEEVNLEDLLPYVDFAMDPTEDMNFAYAGQYGRNFMPRLSGQNIIIIVKPRDSVTPTYPNNLNLLDLTSENKEEIPEEKAVCKFCFKTFETGNMFKAKCMCPTALTHEECILNWSGAKGNNECDVCEQEVQSFSVDWHLGVSYQLQKSSERGWISRLKRIRPCCF